MNETREIEDAHAFPFGRNGHVVGDPSSCRCEPVIAYREWDELGNLTRRIIVHGNLS